MPFIGIGLHVVVALFFAIHAVRSGREIYWLLILFMFPLLGSVVYFFAVYLPESQIQHKVNRTVNVVARSLDPGRELREAHAAFDMTPTAQNQMRLANALMATGETDQAAQHFEACLKGPLAKDPEIRFGAANARYRNGDNPSAIQLLQAIRHETPSFREESLALLLAKAYDSAGNKADAQAELTYAVDRFGSLEAKVECAIWAHANQQLEMAQSLRTDIAKAIQYMPKHAKTVNKALLSRLQATFGP
jgi:hypothetical protein